MCGGSLVDKRTQRSHALRDQTAPGYRDDERAGQINSAQKAINAKEEVLQNQLDVITNYLASATLDDSNPDSPFTDISPFLYMPSKESSVRNQRINRVLERLSEIELTVFNLRDEVAHSLLHSQSTSYLNSKTFPLANLIDQCSYLESDLRKITYKSAAVTGAKDAIQQEVDVISKTLQNAKNDWKKAKFSLQHDKSHEIEYSNGQFIWNLQNSSCLQVSPRP